jgi:hypothetical protein
MPAKSEAQRRFIYGVKGKKFAEAHGFDNKGKLPARVKGKAVKKKPKKKPPKKRKARKKKGY